MSYRRVPERLLDDPEEIADWARSALAAASQAALIGGLRGPNQSSSVISDSARSKAWSLAIKMTADAKPWGPFRSRERVRRRFTFAGEGGSCGSPEPFSARRVPAKTGHRFCLAKMRPKAWSPLQFDRNGIAAALPWQPQNTGLA